MVKIICKHYGFVCNYEIEGEVEHVIEDFGQHTDKVHGINYSKEALMQMILRKSP